MFKNVDADPRCSRYTENGGYGALPIHRKGLYLEYQVSNFLNSESVYAINVDNERAEIPSTLDSRAPIPCVEIRYRFYNGQRTFSQTGQETSQNTHHVIRIPEEVLRESPVYVKTVDLTITLSEHLSYAVHKNSTEFRTSEVERIVSDTRQSIVEMPLSIVANDPSQKISSLYVEIHGQVCAVPVTNYTGYGEDDRIVVAYRNRLLPGTASYTVYRSSFRELLKNDAVSGKIGPCLVSLNADSLSIDLELQEKKFSSEYISIQTHKEKLEALKKFHAEDIAHLRHENEQLSKRNATLSKHLDSLKETKYSDKYAEMAMEGLRLDELKAKADRVKHAEQIASAKEATKSKQRDDRIKLLTTTVKSAAVIGTSVLGIYKIYKSVQSS